MWHVLYYESDDGKCPVMEFIESRNQRNQAKILAVIEALERGPNLPRPYADLLRDGIHEFRVKLAGSQIRVLYFFCYRDFTILTDVLTKITARVPPSDIEMAKRYRDDFLARMDERKLRELVR